jgi:hypothetical protein
MIPEMRKNEKQADITASYRAVVEARARALEQKQQDRRALILGRWFQKQHPSKVQEIAQGLARAADRRLFGLP